MSKKMRSNILLLITAAIWGSSFVAQKSGMDYIEPFTYNGIRTLIGGLVLIPVIYVFGKKHAGADGAPQKIFDWEKDKVSIIGGLFCGAALFVASSLQQFGVMYTTVGKAGFRTARYIVLVPLLGLLLKKRVALPVWVSVVIAAAGTYLLSIQEDFTIAAGDLFVILCAVCFSVHILLVDRFSPSVNGVELSCIPFLVAGVFSTLVAFLVETPNVQDILRSWGPILYTGLISSGVGYTLQILGQKDTPPAVASLIMSLESVFAALSGWLLLGQGMTGREAVGCALVFAAVVLAQIPFDALRGRSAAKKRA